MVALLLTKPSQCRGEVLPVHITNSSNNQDKARHARHNVSRCGSCCHCSNRSDNDKADRHCLGHRMDNTDIYCHQCSNRLANCHHMGLRTHNINSVLYPIHDESTCTASNHAASCAADADALRPMWWKQLQRGNTVRRRLVLSGAERVVPPVSSLMSPRLQSMACRTWMRREYWFANSFGVSSASTGEDRHASKCPTSPGGIFFLKRSVADWNPPCT